jgi:hypothetical protein
VRAVLRSFCKVTVVGSELGRPDDGTDPTHIEMPAVFQSGFLKRAGATADGSPR